MWCIKTATIMASWAGKPLRITGTFWRNPPITDGFASSRACNPEDWCFLYVIFLTSGETTAGLSVIWDAKTLLCRHYMITLHCNVIIWWLFLEGPLCTESNRVSFILQTTAVIMRLLTQVCTTPPPELILTHLIYFWQIETCQQTYDSEIKTVCIYLAV